ncbi:hypothetical protein [Aeromonas enteropelogenes]|uniref:hypothetical protein n=1 Tax=Aeromonas enteropelogenes TaxID=29489 RepID=UPI003BA39F63
MTTTIYDTKKMLIASDSRWSASVALSDGQHLLFVDDTKFHKLADRTGAVLVLAGDGELISSWKEWWISSDGLDPDEIPAVSIGGVRVISVMIVSKLDGEVLFDAGPKSALVVPGDRPIYLAIFSGSGSNFASMEWQSSECPYAALDAAKRHDPCSGGGTMYVEMVGSNHNLHDESFDFSTVTNALLQRGFLMKLAQMGPNTVMPLASHPDCERVMSDLSSGAIRACAPMGGMKNPVDWSEMQHQRLKAAIGKVADIEKAMKQR